MIVLCFYCMENLSALLISAWVISTERESEFQRKDSNWYQRMCSLEMLHVKKTKTFAQYIHSCTILCKCLSIQCSTVSLLYIFVIKCKAPNVKAESWEQPKKAAPPSPVIPGWHRWGHRDYLSNLFDTYKISPPCNNQPGDDPQPPTEEDGDEEKNLRWASTFTSSRPDCFVISVITIRREWYLPCGDKGDDIDGKMVEKPMGNILKETWLWVEISSGSKIRILKTAATNKSKNRWYLPPRGLKNEISACTSAAVSSALLLT